MAMRSVTIKSRTTKQKRECSFNVTHGGGGVGGGLVQADRVALTCGFVTYTHVGLALAWFPSPQMPVGTILPLAEDAELEVLAELAGEDEFDTKGTFARPKKRESMVVQNYKSQQSAVINNVASNSK